MTAADVVARLEAYGHVVRGQGPWSAQCPAHADRDPSLSIGDVDGRVLVHCHAGCAPDDVVETLDLTWRDLFEDDVHHGRRAGRRARPGPPSERRKPAPPLAEVDIVLDAFHRARLSWRCSPRPGSWCAECPVCRDPRRSVSVIDFTSDLGREDEPVLVACVNGCERTAIATALQEESS